jgi:hypothetical protein
MRHEISITGIAHRDTHTMTATLTGTPPTERTHRNQRTVMIRPDIVIAIFVRTPELNTWWCESVEIGGARLRDKDSVATGDRREQVYQNARGMPGWLSLILDILMAELPE